MKSQLAAAITGTQFLRIADGMLAGMRAPLPWSGGSSRFSTFPRPFPCAAPFGKWMPE